MASSPSSGLSSSSSLCSESFRLCAARDGIIDEMSDHAAAIMAFDQSYSFSGFGPIPASSFTDTPGVVTDCGRNTLPGQPGVDDVDS